MSTAWSCEAAFDPLASTDINSSKQGSKHKMPLLNVCLTHSACRTLCSGGATELQLKPSRQVSPGRGARNTNGSPSRDNSEELDQLVGGGLSVLGGGGDGGWRTHSRPEDLSRPREHHQNNPQNNLSLELASSAGDGRSADSIDEYVTFSSPCYPRVDCLPELSHISRNE